MTFFLQDSLPPHFVYSPSSSAEETGSLKQRQQGELDDTISILANNSFSERSVTKTNPPFTVFTELPQRGVSFHEAASLLEDSSRTLAPPLLRLPTLKESAQLFNQPCDNHSLEPFRKAVKEQADRTLLQQRTFTSTYSTLSSRINQCIESLNAQRLLEFSCSCEQADPLKILPPVVSTILDKYKEEVILDPEVRKKDLETLEGIKALYKEDGIVKGLLAMTIALRSLFTTYDNFHTARTNYCSEFNKARVDFEKKREELEREELERGGFQMKLMSKTKSALTDSLSTFSDSE